MKIRLRFRHGRYYAVIEYKYKNLRKEKWFSLNVKDEREYQKAIMELNRQQEIFINEIETEDSFIGYLKSWLDYKKNFIEKSTWEAYKIIVYKHIIPYFSPLHLKLDELKPRHIKEYYQYMYSNGRVDGKGKGLSIPTLVKHSVVIKGALDDAVLDEYIIANPAARVKMPAKNIPSKKPQFLTAEQANKMLKAFEGHRLYPLIYTTLYYGLRRSEVLGLRWSAIDFENNTIEINHTVVKNLTIEAKDATKTDGSQAIYALIPNVKEVLLEQRDQQNKWKEVMKSEYKESDYVFTWEDGKLFLPDYVTRQFQKVLKHNGLPVIRFHDLRHSTASILYDKGWSMKDVQLWLRHASIDTTSDIYTHITASRKLAMADNITRLLDNTTA